MNIKILSIAVAIAVALVGCDNSPKKTTSKAVTATSATSTTDTNTPANPNATKYIMAVDGAYAPFAFKDEKGQVIGFDTDLIRAIGKKQGFEVEVISQPWSGIFDSLNNGSRDIVGSGVVWTPERAEKMNLSDPTMVVPQTAIYLGSRNDIHSFEDLKTKKVGVQGDTPYDKQIRDYMGANAKNVTSYESSFIGFQDMTNGKIDAMYNNGNINAYLINIVGKKYNINNIKTIQMPNIPPEKMIFAVKKGRNDLTKKINDGLAQIKQDGTYNQIYKKWFGDTPIITETATTPASTATSVTPTSAPAK